MAFLRVTTIYLYRVAGCRVQGRDKHWAVDMAFGLPPEVARRYVDVVSHCTID